MPEDVLKKMYGHIRPLLLSIVAVAIFAIALLVSLEPVLDNDFWWHLKTGELIVTSKSLPTSDPFAFPHSQAASSHEKFLLTSYWLSQSILYSVFSVAGFKGFILLRFMLAAALIGSVYSRMRSLKIDQLLGLSIIAASTALFSTIYSLDRPHIVSFILASLLLGLFERVREEQRYSIFLFPLMLVWSNLHGGFVIGDILLSLFAAGAVVQYRKEPRIALKTFAWAAGGVLASLANPNGVYAFSFLFKSTSSASMEFVSEFMGTFAAFDQGNKLVVVLWVMAGLTIIAMLRNKKRFWPDLLITAFLGYASISYLRNTAFFIFALAPLSAYYIQHSISAPATAILSRFSPALPIAILSMVAAGFALNGLEITYPVKMWSGLDTYMTKKFPSDTAEFISSSGLQGNMYNDYNWGGYFIYRLWPKQKVFIDGRVVNPSQLDDYFSITKADMEKQGNLEKYKILLRRYDIDFIVQPLCQPNGSLQPLMKFMLNDPEWVPVYLDSKSYIIARKLAANEKFISGHTIDRLQFVNKVLGFFADGAVANPGELQYLLAEGEMLIYLGRLNDAEKVLLSAKKIAPANPLLEKNLKFIRTGSYK